MELSRKAFIMSITPALHHSTTPTQHHSKILLHFEKYLIIIPIKNTRIKTDRKSWCNRITSTF
jgi:hypothetical protein